MAVVVFVVTVAAVGANLVGIFIGDTLDVSLRA